MKKSQVRKSTSEAKTDTLGGRIKDLRIKAGYKAQKDFADVLGVSTTVLSRWEKDVNQPDYNALRDIANLVGSNCDYIIRGVSTEHLDAHKHYGLTNDALNVLLKLNNLKYEPPYSSFSFEPIQVLNALICLTDFSYMVKKVLDLVDVKLLNYKVQFAYHDDGELSDFIEKLSDLYNENEYMRNRGYQVVAPDILLASKNFEVHEDWKFILKHLADDLTESIRREHRDEY